VLEEAGGYDVTLRGRGGEGCEDWDLALKIAERTPIAIVPKVLVAYRRGSETMSAQRDRMWRSFALMTRAVVERRTLPAGMLRRSHDQFALHLAGSAYWSGAYREAIAWGLRARKSSVALRVLPQVLRLLTRSSRPSERRSIVRAGVPFDSLDLPPPLMPYDRIYRGRS